MKSTLEYLEAAKAAAGIESDYALAVRIGLSRQGISHLRVGRAIMSDDTAAKIATLAGVDPLAVMAAAHIERAGRSKRPGSVAVWEQIAKKAAGAAALLLLASGLSAPVDGWAAGVRAGAVHFIHYAQSIYRRLAAVGRFYALRPA